MNIPLWLKELEVDEDKEFLIDGIVNGFRLNLTEVLYTSAEMENYLSSTKFDVRDKVEETILNEIRQGNYVIIQDKPAIVSALGAIPKPDSTDVRLIHA